MLLGAEYAFKRPARNQLRYQAHAQNWFKPNFYVRKDSRES